MSFRAMAWAFERDELSSLPKLTLLVLASCHNDETGRCDPSIAWLARKTGMAKRSVYRCLDELVGAGALTIEKRSDPNTGAQLRSQYDMPLGTPAQSKVTHSHGDSATEAPGVMTDRHKPDATQAPLSKTGIETGKDNQSSSSTDVDADFDAWWAAYPRKVGKDAARAKYAKARRSVSAETLLAAVAQMPPQSDPTFIPHPATWLNQGRWQDEAPATPRVDPRRQPPDDGVNRWGW